MPVFQEQIQDYRVTIVLGDLTSSTRFIHINFLTFPGYAVLRFAPGTLSSIGELTKVKGQMNNFVYQAQLNLRIEDYIAYLDLLRYERPLGAELSYDVEPALGQKVPIFVFKLFTWGKEPIGEGPVDNSL